ncbi:MAG: NADP-dependent phosphogluconate dehydrogenase [Deltaproteobacteria bacterium]|nr:NADP-dependent phosphogluconate dehydrogenase [Deltaproteobacteria bacterium]
MAIPGVGNCEMGLVGLGVMGRNLVLNLTDKGFPVAVYNRTPERTREFMEREVTWQNIRPGYTLEEFVGLLRRPRAILILVTAGSPMDAVIEELLPLLGPRDLIIDGGNSHFIDTSRRSRLLAEKGLLFMGLGISGGEQGARHGPSLMPGGSPEAYARVQTLLEAIAAQKDGKPCVAYLGNGSCGHYVKMVHNGIEYGLMQLLAETYDFMKRGLGLTAPDLAAVYEGWNHTELHSYLVEITAKIFRRQDEATGQPLVELILDQAKQKGTGMWTSWDAMDLQSPTPVIDVAVGMRDLSGYKVQREEAAQVLPGPPARYHGAPGAIITHLQRALYAAMVITYAQGLALLSRASRAYRYDLNLEAVVRVWRAGCIIRAAVLEDIRGAYQTQPGLPNLLLDPRLGKEILARQNDLRAVASLAAHQGLPVPAFMAALAYFDAYRSPVLPANLTQAQRDFFGAHTYERVDMPGVFHTEWEEE